MPSEASEDSSESHRTQIKFLKTDCRTLGLILECFQRGLVAYLCKYHYCVSAIYSYSSRALATRGVERNIRGLASLNYLFFVSFSPLFQGDCPRHAHARTLSLVARMSSTYDHAAIALPIMHNLLSLFVSAKPREASTSYRRPRTNSARKGRRCVLHEKQKKSERSRKEVAAYDRVT
jgi:hypothetical protein